MKNTKVEKIIKSQKLQEEEKAQQYKNKMLEKKKKEQYYEMKDNLKQEIAKSLVDLEENNSKECLDVVKGKINELANMEIQELKEIFNKVQRTKNKQMIGAIVHRIHNQAFKETLEDILKKNDGSIKTRRKQSLFSRFKDKLPGSAFRNQKKEMAKLLLTRSYSIQEQNNNLCKNFNVQDKNIKRGDLESNKYLRVACNTTFSSILKISDSIESASRLKKQAIDEKSEQQKVRNLVNKSRGVSLGREQSR